MREITSLNLSQFSIKEEPNEYDYNEASALFSCIDNALEPYKCGTCSFEHHLMTNFNKHEEVTPTNYGCKNCEFSTNSQLVLMKHIDTCKVNTKWHTFLKETLNGLERFKCEQCPFRTRMRSYLRRHKRNTHTAPGQIKWFKCDQCPFKSKWKGNVKGHMVSKHTISRDKIKLKCGQCSFITRWKSCLTKHVQAKHTDLKKLKWAQCEQCSYKTIRGDMLKRHVVTKHTAIEHIKWFNCRICGHQTKRGDHLKRHLQEKHSIFEDGFWVKASTSKLRDILMGKRNKPKISSIEDKPKVWVKCDCCSYVTEWEGALKVHKLMTHKNDQGNRQLDLEKHELKKRTVAENTVNWWQCGQCGYRSQMVEELRTHIRTEHSAPPGKCFEQVPTRSYDLRRQIVAKHTGNLKCEHCSFNAQWGSALRVHKLIVHGIKTHDEENHTLQMHKNENLPPIKLSKCKKKNCPDDLKRLNQKHSFDEATEAEEAPGRFKCDQCSYTTEQEGDLSSHRQECNHKTVEKDDLGKHTEIISEVEDCFRCGQCSYKSSRYVMWKRHIQAKHEPPDKWFECNICSQKMKYHHTFKQHMSRKHTIYTQQDCWIKVSEESDIPENKMWFECGQCSYKSEWKGSLKVHQLIKHAVSNPQ